MGDKPTGSPSKAFKLLLWALCGLTVLSAGISILIVLDSLRSPIRPATNLVQPESNTRQTPPSRTFRDGLRKVGSGIAPGTYRTRERSPGCYWARLAGFSGELGDLIANGNEMGAAVVTIRPSDQGFESRSCGTWTSDLSSVTSAVDDPFGDGKWIVGTDIAPGTWRAAAPETCYWARLRGFSGGLGDLIANDNGNGVVTITGSDRGFSSQRCGLWTKEP